MKIEPHEIKLHAKTDVYPTQCTCCGSEGVDTVDFRADDPYCIALVCRKYLRVAAKLFNLNVIYKGGKL